ncbi:Hypothetical predicted protein [Mytilus galloprovincialis]|uniref:Uncharacterized protein n=1 Tax=Mytilus galloprovincialis TaxID=29158 RepID=A0A8B6GCS5_MYTGA|nr:Hypothetical predicted protein [Mytilus galloprovincialis]
MKLEISDMQKCINEKLDGLIKTYFESMDDMQVQHNRTTSKGIESLQKKLEVLQNIKLDICQAKENCTNIQLFLSLSEFESMLSREENLRSVSMEKGELDNTELMIRINDDFKNMSSIGDICNIIPQKTKIHINHLCFGQSAKMTPLIENQVVANIDSIQIQKKCEMKFQDSPKCVTGCTSLRDDSLLFVDHSGKRVILFDSNSRFLRNIELDSKPYDIAAVDDSVVAVTLSEANKILFIDFSSDQDKVTIK